MNRDDVIRMMREVIEERGGSRVDDEADLLAYSIQLAALVAAHEREECAKVCEEVAKPYQVAGASVALECVAAIRARGEMK
jgi:hypothetical protein